MATGARLLLLDEPAAGMNPNETHEITELIGRLRDERGYTILVIEHDMHVVEGISDRVVALDHGEKLTEGTVRGGRQPSRGHRGLPRPQPGGTAEVSAAAEGAPPLLELDDVTTYYGQMRILEGISLQVGAGRARLPARRQRLGQVDDAEDDPRHRAPAQRARPARRRGGQRPQRPAAHRARPRDRARRTAACSAS